MSRQPDARTSSSQKVDWFELFYDLIIVAAIGVVDSVFQASPDWKTSFLAVVALLVLFAMWLLTTMSQGLVADEDPVRRAFILVQMLLISIAALVLGTDGLPIWIGFTATGAALLTITVLYLRGARGADVVSRVVRDAIWLSAAGAAAFLAAGAGSARLDDAQATTLGPLLILAGAAVVLIPLMTVGVAHATADGSLDTGHLQERFGMLVIIVLGESFAGVLAALGSLGAIPNPMYFLLAFILPFSIWSIYFRAVIPYGMPDEAGRLRGWMLAHAILVISMVSVAVEFADLTLNDDGWTSPRFDGNWTPLPIAGVLAAILLLSFVQRTCPRPVRIVHLTAFAVVLALWVVDIAVGGHDSNWLSFASSLVVIVDAIGCSAARRRASGGR